jgi:hypothetical protein
MTGTSRTFRTSRIALSSASIMIASALFLQSCGTPAIGDDAPAIYGGSDANPPADAVPYGIDGELEL